MLIYQALWLRNRSRGRSEYVFHIKEGKPFFVDKRVLLLLMHSFMSKVNEIELFILYL